MVDAITNFSLSLDNNRQDLEGNICVVQALGIIIP